MLDCAEKAQHLRRWSTQTIRNPRVACTIVWQPWAIKSTTPMALERAFYILVHVFSRLNSWRIGLESATPTALKRAFYNASPVNSYLI